MITHDLLMNLTMTFSLVSANLVLIGIPFLAKGDIDNSEKCLSLGIKFVALAFASVTFAVACLITSIWIR